MRAAVLERSRNRGDNHLDQYLGLLKLMLRETTSTRSKKKPAKDDGEVASQGAFLVSRAPQPP